MNIVEYAAHGLDDFYVDLSYRYADPEQDPEGVPSENSLKSIWCLQQSVRAATIGVRADIDVITLMLRVVTHRLNRPKRLTSWQIEILEREQSVLQAILPYATVIGALL
jgi:hypothetical protein